MNAANTASSAFEPIVGRYLNLAIERQEHRLYIEEAGQGIPLLCLHTAGSDSRQYRGLMNDEDITRHFRVICFDMPWHGKSSPPCGWQESEYRLSAKSYLEMVMTVKNALGLDQPVVIGCSIGGRMVLHLALKYAAEFRALIGLQSGGHVAPYYDMQWLHRPDVHGGEVCAGIVSGLMAPQSPSEHRWETLWHYMQGGPGVFKGDLYFYKVDGDVRDQVSKIDTSVCPLYLLTGEYDYSCTPADTLALAAAVKGAQVKIMPKLGHFPMSENPDAFLDFLRPVLAEIRRGAG